VASALVNKFGCHPVSMFQGDHWSLKAMESPGI